MFKSMKPAFKTIQQLDSPQSFFYCDPPYPNTNQGHYKGYSTSDFKDLVDLASNSQGSFIISCYNQDDSFKEYSDLWTKAEFTSYNSSGGNVNSDRTVKSTAEQLGNRKRTEVLYIKQAVTPREEITKLYDSGKYDCFEGKIGEKF